MWRSDKGLEGNVVKYLWVVEEHSKFQNFKFSIIIIIFFVVSQTNNSAINDLIFFAISTAETWNCNLNDD